MPPAETEITIDLVRSLLTDQRPDLADLEISPFASGWDNLSFRLGDDFLVRLPRRAMAAELVVNEAHWLPELADRLPLPVPTPVFLGQPGRGYPWHWSIVPWMPGRPATETGELDLDACASDLGGFLRALHHPAPPEAPGNPYRGVPLAERHHAVVERIDRLGELIDSEQVRDRWERACAVAVHEGPPLWIHGDLHPGNLLISDGRISGVIDFGDITSGDPSTDLAVAWMIFPAGVRSVFVESYGGVDEASWERAAGWALSLATGYLSGSADNPAMGEIGMSTIDRVLRDG